MEEEKAAAYYDELTRKGEGAARFKQGLGFSSSSNNDAVPAKGSSLASFSSSSSFLSQFVKASSPTSSSKLEKESQLQSIQSKLKKKKPEEHKTPRVAERRHRHRSSSRDRDREDRETHHKRRSRSRSRERYRDRDRERDRYGDRDTDGDRERKRRRSRSRSPSRREQRRSKKRSEYRERGEELKKEKNGKIDYSRLIEGYDKMSAAERVKAKMKFQLAETGVGLGHNRLFPFVKVGDMVILRGASMLFSVFCLHNKLLTYAAEKDATTGSGWERFEFNKDAPLDDEQVEAADDDAALVKHIGQSFRFSAIEARREEQIKAAHDEAMFGAPALPLSITAESELDTEDSKKDGNESSLSTSLLSDKVLVKQQGSWRDRARKS